MLARISGGSSPRTSGDASVRTTVLDHAEDRATLGEANPRSISLRTV